MLRSTRQAGAREGQPHDRLESGVPFYHLNYSSRAQIAAATHPLRTRPMGWMSAVLFCRERCPGSSWTPGARRHHHHHHRQYTTMMRRRSTTSRRRNRWPVSLCHLPSGRQNCHGFGPGSFREVPACVICECSARPLPFRAPANFPGSSVPNPQALGETRLGKPYGSVHDHYCSQLSSMRRVR